jgi:lipoprotein-anchoring transpeptidase ErfK/SrfK
MRLAGGRPRRGQRVGNVKSRGREKPDSPPGLRRKLNIQQKLLIAVFSAITMLLLLAVGVWAYDNAQKDQIAPGIKIGGVDIGGRSADSARKIIKNEVVAPLRQPVVVSFEGEDYRISPRRLEQTADIDGMVDEAIEASRAGGLLERVSRYASGSDVNTDLEPKIGYSESEVEDFVAELAGRVDREAQNASIVPNGDTLRPTPGHEGIQLQQDQMYDLITEQVRSPGRDAEVQAVVKSTEPESTKKELAKAYPTYLTIDRSSFTLRLFKNLRLTKRYTIAVGASGYDTPSGLYNIETKEVNPTWHVPESGWAGSLAGQDIPPGPGNPLVARWMGIYDGAGIHGTDDTGSLGSAASHGCIRMAVDEVIELFDKVEVGDPVYIQ